MLAIYNYSRKILVFYTKRLKCSIFIKAGNKPQ